MLFASDLCFICKYFQSQCNFVQLLQVFINNLMRLFQRTDRGIVNYGLSRDDDDGDDDVGDDGSQCLSSTTALFWATVSFCCQSLIAKEHINFSSRTGEDFTFLFICSQGFSLPFFLKCFTLWVKFNKKNPPKKQQQKKHSCQTAATVSAVSRQYWKCVGWIFLSDLFVSACFNSNHMKDY